MFKIRRTLAHECLNPLYTHIQSSKTPGGQNVGARGDAPKKKKECGLLTL